MQQQQMELDMRNTDQRGAARAAADADLLADIFRKRPDLQRRPADTLAQFMGWTDRRLRAAAEASGGAILSAPGCTGYRLAEATPVADYYATERARYRSQIRVMAARLIAMDRAVHAAHPRPFEPLNAGVRGGAAAPYPERSVGRED